MKRVVIEIAVPDDYDMEPLVHRIKEQLAAIRCEEPNEADEVPEDLQCPELIYWIR